MAELAERLPEGAEEVVLGRRVSATGRTSAFVAGRAASAADLKLLGGRLLAFYGQHEHRKLTISSAQMEVLDGFAGAEHLELRRALPRGAPRVRAARRRAGRAARARRLAGARPRPLPLRAVGDRGGGARPRRGGGAGGRARAAAPRRGAARGGGRRPRRRSPAPTRTAAARRARWPRPRRCCRASAGVDAELDALAERLGAARGRAGRRRRASCATTSRGSRPTPGGSPRSRSGSTRSTGCERKHGGSVESVLAHAERCRAEIERLEGAEERGAEAEAALAEAEARRAKLGERLSKGRAKAAGAAARSEVAEELERLAMPGATLEVVLEPHPDGFGAERRARRSSCGSRPTRDRAGAAARRRLGRRALAGDAGAERPRRGRRAPARWSSTRSTPGSAATPPASSASGCGRWARAARSSASPTCRRSPRWPRPTSGSRRTSPASGRPRPCERLDGEGVVEEIRRMLGGEQLRRGGDPPRARAARRGLKRLRLPLARAANLRRWQPPVAVASLRCSRVATGRRAAEAIDGTARLGRRTKHLVKRLRPGDVAVIDHVNIDRIAAEELIATGVRRGDQRLAVLQRPLPERRPAAARPGRGRADRRRRAPTSSSCSRDGDRLTIDGGAVQRRRARGAARAGARRRASWSASSTSSASGSTRRSPSSPRTPSPTCARRPTC